MTRTPALSLSVITPTKNNAGLITAHYEAVTRVLEEQETSFELLYVDDGSTDDSPRVISGIARDDFRVRGIFLEPSHGQQTAVLVGLLDNSADILVTLDLDLEVPARAVPEFAAAVRNGADYVSGVRKNRKHGNLLRLFGSHGFLLLMRYRTGLPIRDFGCGATALTRDLNSKLLRSREKYYGLKHLAGSLARSMVNMDMPAVHVSGTRSSYGPYELGRALLHENRKKIMVEFPPGIRIRETRKSRRLPPFDPFDPEFRKDPYAVYARYRDHEPVHWGLPKVPSLPGTWYVTRYADAVSVLGHDRFSRTRPEDTGERGRRSAFSALTRHWMLMKDRSDHARIRRVVGSAFKSHLKDPLHGRIAGIAGAILSRALARAGGGGSFDLVSEFAFPFPVVVIADLMGIPRDMNGQLESWTRDLLPTVDFKKDDSRHERTTAAAAEFSRYLAEVVSERRGRPRDDLISTLIRFQDESSDITDEELVANCVFLFIAGHETTVNLIGNGIHALMAHRDMWTMLKEDASRIPAAVEELLRYDSPVQATSRFATENTIVGNKLIKKGEHVCLLLGAANRDPDQFPDPGVLDMTRSPNRHIAFSHGSHYCLGAALARLEARCALESLCAKIPDLRLDVNGVLRKSSINLHGFQSLPVLAGSDHAK